MRIASALALVLAFATPARAQDVAWQPDAAVASPRSNEAHLASWVLMPSGGVALTVATALLLAAELHDAPVCGSACRPPATSATDLWIAGGVTMGLGAIALVVGIVLLATTPRWDRASVTLLPTFFDGGGGVGALGTF